MGQFYLAALYLVTVSNSSIDFSPEFPNMYIQNRGELGNCLLIQ
jgi:hypothetical protein